MPESKDVAGNAAAPCAPAVVISYWAGRGPRNLLRLLGDLQRLDAGMPHTLTVVCNGGDQKPLALPRRFATRVKVLNRANAGYNIGAWEHGWRNDPHSSHFLFLQDECRVLRAGWLKAFFDRLASSSDIGLVGESSNWDRPWHEQRLMPLAAACLNRDGEPAFNSVDFLHDFLVGIDVPPGDTALHLQSLVLFTSRRVLQEIDGFSARDTYAEAVGTEIAISKKVMAQGYRIAIVGEQPFSVVAHPQWASEWTKRWTRLRLGLRQGRMRVAGWLGRAGV